jgi:hypothetical protein
MIEIHLHPHQGGGLLRLQRVGVGYYQVVYTDRKGETRKSPLFQDGGMAAKWAISLMKRIAQEASSPSKAGV